MRMHERHSDKPSLHDVRQHAGGQRPAGEFVFSADVFTRLREASTWWSQPVCPQHLQVRGQTTQIPDGDTMSKANGGARRDRTDDLLLAKQALSQLSYGPAATGGSPNPKVEWWARVELNYRPHAYQACALTT